MIRFWRTSMCISVESNFLLYSEPPKWMKLCCRCVQFMLYIIINIKSLCKVYDVVGGSNLGYMVGDFVYLRNNKEFADLRNNKDNL